MLPANLHGQALRDQIDHAMGSRQYEQARARMRQLWDSAPGPATAKFIVSRARELRAITPSGRLRLAILSSFTLDPVVPLIEAAAAAHGIDLDVHLGGFNAYAQEILDTGSALYRFSPDVVILAVQTRDAEPELWDSITDLTPDQVTGASQRLRDRFAQLFSAFRLNSTATLVAHGFETPDFARNGILDGQSISGQREVIRQLNTELLRAASKHPGIHFLDYEALIARHGKSQWNDEGRWLSIRMPLTSAALNSLTCEWLRFLLPAAGKARKALIVDLDNTLWGGVIAEDGMNGIRIGNEYPGAAFRGLQRVILDLYQRGVVLGICSKNNPADALEALEKHPGMLLRPEHFAAVRINWNDKVRNLREIAGELNIGPDALAFLDDNPAEREWVRSQMPEVAVIELPEDPVNYTRTLRECPHFERLSASEEDRRRTQYYAEQRLRNELRNSTGSLEDFYRSLNMQVEISPVTSKQAPRIAQLTQKTNQFNMTTRRYTEQQIAALIANPCWRVYSLRVADRFGDNGLVGAAVLRVQETTCEIDTFLLSCRVIGRTIETALLAAIAAQARDAGAHKLVGVFVPTQKNQPAEAFYRSHGFSCVRQDGNACWWEFDVREKGINTPPWIEIMNTAQEIVQ
jgi:FkbH-like protein